ncbi:MAG: endonuclease MutS2 [Ignavibacteriales bacterium]|nr:endonuclease MutS2 [Ignavibacteriales bacterium]
MADFSTAIRKLEFDKVLDRLQQLVASGPAWELATHLIPMTNPQLIELELQRVSEAKELLIIEGAAPLDGIKDILPALKRASIENHVLNSRELLEIASTLRASRTLASFLAKRQKTYPRLAAFLAQLYSDKVIEYNILECIDEEGHIRDSASKELLRIRHEIISTADTLRKRLASILKRVSEKDFLQEEIVTTRDGRMVVPVKTEYKKQVPGFIHTSSASGATVFIEPAETLDLNNALTELQLSEQREIANILSNLTEQVREIQPHLEPMLSTLSTLDLLFAKAKYSIEIHGNPPRICEKILVRLYQARHPVLLQRHRREDVVPLDIEMGETVRTLVISGPNAGGKSVAMKCVGLLALCAQSGLHIPAAPESELGVFESIFVDIGDEQSIEDDLSSYSSHLIRMRDVVVGANPQSLVLLDEIGAGTDPAEGGALAASILTELTQRGAMTIATTHHGMLKAFAHETPHVSNASMEFDQETLKPTYRFRSGVPGSSYALELAKRLDLPLTVVNRAREFVGDEKIKLENLLAELERQTQECRAQIRDVSDERDKLNSLVKVYEQKTKDLREELKVIRKQAVEEAKDIVHGAQALIERSVKEIRESSAEKKTVQAARENIKVFLKKIQDMTVAEDHTSEATLEVGDVVRVKDSSQEGELVELKPPVATVLFGNAKLKVRLETLVKVKDRKGSTGESVASALYTPEGRTEIDLRGMLGDEAIPQVERFLDDALVSGLHRVDIIHGKGTGALRKRITQFLKTYPHIKSFRLGEWNEGGAGVTVVELD